MSGAPRAGELEGHGRDTAPVDAPGPLAQADVDDEHGRSRSPRAALLTLGGFLLASLAALYFLLPKLAGLQDTWHRIRTAARGGWSLALVFTVGMFGGYVMQFRGIFLRAAGGRRIDWRAAYEITMAGLAASRIFAAGGAGGLVLHGLGAAALGDGQARRRRHDGRLPDPHLLALRGRARRLRPRAVTSGSSRARRRSR